ncbi:LLM class flavin-dependent oxidoreductase [Rhodoplanes sp. TEM]|uniref:LLM class flavin-dependent oxidoreductase n=1 Tax=Rhodoplanes tepidamans TaxID=200616 RepID=A0ABT5JCQ7_RHOTP|nr:MULTISPECIES: LLM class flavin-dependent oxidoreductase [Rhodoplanes]MDC7787146.1 LLM class flavin-dependent oxidoreductase [Rhodoplanes tepidamans]MDC7984290.1 LLM class flavin-dependent oxidoreductase [Rhodoplanes sp. TEM]MDQ0356087.1 5,10-methylenetetrahydromethanopterin reductase [Rhodoplanes tepidamans]
MTSLPQLGIRLHGGQTPGACVALATAADAAGLSGLWFAENAFARGILPAAAACALATRRVAINAGVFNPFSRHPTMMAMEIGAIDELSNGRAGLSIGSGIASAVAKLGMNAEKPVPALRDTLVIVRGLLRGEEVDHAGPAFTARKVRLDHAARADIPILVAGRGNLTARLAGELADGLIVSNMCSAAFAGRVGALMQEARQAAGRTGRARVVQYLPCAVHRDRAVALAAGKRAVGAMVPGFWALGQRLASAKEALTDGTGIAEAEFAAAAARLRAGEDAAAVLDERYTDAFALAGTPDDCLAAAARYAAAGVTELALTFEGETAAADIATIGAALGAAAGRA